MVGQGGGSGQQGSSVIQPIAGDFMDMMGIAGVFNAIALISISLSFLAVIAAYRTAKHKGIPRKAI